MGVIELLLLKHVFVEFLELNLEGLDQLLIFLKGSLVFLLQLFF